MIQCVWRQCTDKKKKREEPKREAKITNRLLDCPGIEKPFLTLLDK
jgi:hypothetical protein